ncbi:MAG: hypothetical protein GYB68_15965, partial [Chloroflexi bacterium]|nr:hypothetical protein [Chloroflexota bacterium]
SANILSNNIEQWQAKFEGFYFDMRKNLFEYDEAVNVQRQTVYDERRAILESEGEELDGLLERFMMRTLERVIYRLGDGYRDWATGELQPVIEDFSDLGTNEVNTRGVLQRVRALLPPLDEDEVAEILEIDDATDLEERLTQLIEAGIDEGYNLRVLRAEINRTVPVWPLYPAFGQRGVLGWDEYVEQTLATAERYVSALSDVRQDEIIEPLREGLEDAFHDQLTAINKGASPSDTQQEFYIALSEVLDEAFEAVLDELEIGELLGALSERISSLLEIAHHKAEERQGQNGANLTREVQVYGIGDEEIGNYQRALILSVMDTEWRQYLTAIDDLRQAAGLEAFGQRDPKVQFKRRAFEMFENFRQDIEEGIARRFFAELPRHRQIVERQQQQEARLDALARSGYRVKQQVQKKAGGKKQVVQTIEKDMWSNVGRNDLCPCGSGKKFKDCHYNEVREQMAEAAASNRSSASSNTSRSRKRRRRRR